MRETLWSTSIALVLSLAGCAPTPQRVAQPADLRAEPGLADIAPAARFLFRLTTPAEDGRLKATAGSGVQLAADLICTAAHCVPEALLWDGEAEATLVIDSTPRTATLLSSGLDDLLVELRSDPIALARERQRQIHSARDWALLRIDPPMPSSAIERLGQDPADGESAWLIGFPDRYLDPGWRSDLSWPLAEGWRPPGPVGFVGMLSRVRDDWLELRLEGRLESFGGASGSGVFVRRDGELALIGIASQGVPGSQVVVLARLPTRERLLGASNGR